MKEIQLNTVVGETFEDLSISEMVQVQGSGDVTVETTYVCATALSFAFGIGIVKTCKGKC